MKRTALKPGKPHKIPDYIRDLLWERCHGRCDFCGQQMNGMDAHHRQQRSLGGKDKLSNLVGLHRRCHNLIHDNMTTASLAGWFVPSTQDPSDVLVILFDGEALLDDLGKVQRLQ